MSEGRARPLEHLEPDGHPAPVAPYSSVVAAGDVVATSGQVPFGPDGRLVGDDFRAQAEQVFANLERCLAAAGCSLGDALKVNAYLASFDDFAEFNDVYTAYFAPPFPARTTIQAGLYGFKVEVEAWARRPE